MEDEFLRQARMEGRVKEAMVTLEINGDFKQFLRAWDVSTLKNIYDYQIETENYEVCNDIIEIIKEKENQKV